MRRADGWEMFDICEHQAYATCNRDQAEVTIDPDGVDVRLEGGSGYERWNGSTWIPMDVIVELMRRAGYTVTKTVTE